jgi:AraC-like DNA-binding protein
MTRMRDQLHLQVAVAALAAEVGLSASRLTYLFRSTVGKSPGAYLHALRMERARLLIHHTDLSVREVMQQVGISDPSHFSRDFRNAHGLSPRAYRTQLRMLGAPSRYVNAR